MARQTLSTIDMAARTVYASALGKGATHDEALDDQNLHLNRVSHWAPGTTPHEPKLSFDERIAHAAVNFAKPLPRPPSHTTYLQRDDGGVHPYLENYEGSIFDTREKSRYWRPRPAFLASKRAYQAMHMQQQREAMGYHTPMHITAHHAELAMFTGGKPTDQQLQMLGRPSKQPGPILADIEMRSFTSGNDGPKTHVLHILHADHDHYNALWATPGSKQSLHNELGSFIFEAYPSTCPRSVDDHTWEVLNATSHAWRPQNQQADLEVDMRRLPGTAVFKAFGACAIPANYAGPINVAVLRLIAHESQSHTVLIRPEQRAAADGLYKTWKKCVCYSTELIGHLDATSLAGIDTMDFDKQVQRLMRPLKHAQVVYAVRPLAGLGERSLGGTQVPFNNSSQDDFALLEPMLAPDLSTLKKVTPTVSSYTPNPDLDAVCRAERATELPAVTTAFQCVNDTVNLTCSVILTDAKHKVLEEHQAGHIMQPLMLKHGQVNWRATNSSANTTVALAPAFAALAGTWLDRTMAATLTSAIAWSGINRGPEVDPQSRAAMRAAANLPIDLTRYYIRAWAMYHAAVCAYARREVYRPRPTHGLRHVVGATDSFATWSAMLVRNVFGGESSLFFDGHCLTDTSDICSVLALITAEKLSAAGTAEWLWPTMSKCRLYTNIVSPLLHIDGLDHYTVAATINWLADSTDTHDQMLEAKNFVSAIAMRPNGWGIFGTAMHNNQLVVALPRAVTAGQCMAPYSLFNTTIAEPSGTRAGFTEPLQHLRSTAIASTNYVYSICKAATTVSQPAWWCKTAASMYAAHTASKQRLQPLGWSVAINAADIRHKQGLHLNSATTCNMWPAARNAAARISASKCSSMLDVLAWSEQPYSNDPAVPLFAKVEIMPTDAIQIGMPIRIATVVGSAHVNLAANTLCAAGAQIGYITSSRALGTISSVCWAPRGPTAHSDPFPTAQPNWAKFTPVVRFKDHNELFATTAMADARRHGTWWIQAKYIQPDLQSADGAEEGPEPVVEQPKQQGGSTPQQLQGDEPPPDDDSQCDSQHADLPDTTAPPQTVLQIKGQDALIDTLAAYHSEPEARKLRMAYNTMAEWTIPSSLAEDNRALEWIADNVQAVCGAKQADDPGGHAASIVQKLNEQIRLNVMRSAEQTIARAKAAQLTENVMPDQPAVLTTGRASQQQHLPAPAAAQQPEDAAGHAPGASQTWPAANVNDLPQLQIATSL